LEIKVRLNESRVIFYILNLGKKNTITIIPELALVILVMITITKENVYFITIYYDSPNQA